MKVKELLKALEGVDPEAEVIGGSWNGRVDTYEVLDHTHHIQYDELRGDFYGTPIMYFQHYPTKNLLKYYIRFSSSRITAILSLR